MPDAHRRLLTLKSDPGATEIESVSGPTPAESEVVLALDLFSLTTNNITYAAYGDAIGYWSVFPTGRDGYGLMPVWGFADVVASRAEGVEVGARVFGYFPMADTLVVQAEKVSRGGFADASPWRKAVPDIYNRYVLCAADRHYDPALESAEAIFRPLFVTSYTAVDFLRDNGFFGARRIVVSSASSLYLDLAGDPALRRRVHARLGDDLTYDCLVGSTLGDAFPQHDPGLVGPRPEFFFAATTLDRHRERGTLHAFYERFLADQKTFFQHVTDPAHPWITLVEHQGLEAGARVVRALADHGGDPAEGAVVRLVR